MFSEDCSAREVGLPTRGGPVLAAQRLGGTLAQEIHLEGGVYSDEAVFTRDVAFIVGMVDGPELHTRILVYEIV